MGGQEPSQGRQEEPREKSTKQRAGSEGGTESTAGRQEEGGAEDSGLGAGPEQGPRERVLREGERRRPQRAARSEGCMGT